KRRHKTFLVYFFDKPQGNRKDSVKSLTAVFEVFTLKSSWIGTSVRMIAAGQ
ncbi:hypothetical protein BD408DRAFT_340556, partial [Parasitella parasitica]